MSCGSGPISSKVRVGVDPTWYPINFGELQPFVNGYVENFLLEIAKDKNVEFVKMTASWDNLLQGLRERKFDAILSTLPPYPFNEAEFAFSENFLTVGPVIVTKVGQKGDTLADFQSKLVGVVSGSDSYQILLQKPTIFCRIYPNAPALLDDLSKGNLDAALVEKPFALSYVHNIYSGILQIASDSLTDLGIHLITRKDESFGLPELFDSQAKSQDLQKLQKKWSLQ